MSTIKDAHGWFTTVSSGSGPYTMPPSGPWYGRDAALAAMERWRGRAGYWGRMVTVRTPSGRISGIARALSPDGGLVLRLESGSEVIALAGDLEVVAGEETP